MPSGGSYKYLRGGPGACFLYLHPRHLDGSLRTLDIGWFAKRDAFAYRRPDPPELAEGGDAFLESTPPVLTWYQARAGQRLALALDVARVRAYSLQQQQTLVELLHDRAASHARGGSPDQGAFVVIDDARARSWCDALARAASSPMRAARTCGCARISSRPATSCAVRPKRCARSPAERPGRQALRVMSRTTISSVTTRIAAARMPTMMTWWGLIVTASRRIASPLRTPKKLHKTAFST